MRVLHLNIKCNPATRRASFVIAIAGGARGLDLAALNVPNTVAAFNSLERDAREGEQGPRANALWRIGLLGNRGVEPERAFEILMSAIHDENVNVRYWAVEGLAYLRTDSTVTPLLSIFHDDASPRRGVIGT